MFNEILTPMNHREIEYNAKKLSECEIPDSFACDKALHNWLDETGKRVFDSDLVMDYGTDCLRLYLLFEKTPEENDAPYYESWNEGALEGIYKFLGRYRRVILAADEWNRRGNYHEDTLPAAGIDRMSQALKDTTAKIRKYISRGNIMPNRHNVAAALMELLNIYQKELKTGEIVAAFHAHAVETAVPHGDTAFAADIEQSQEDRQNPDVTRLCQDYVILMAPYAPNLSKILWSAISL